MADADENAKKAFFDGAIQNPLFADDIRELVAKQPAVADWADASGHIKMDVATSNPPIVKISQANSRG